jgi:hypothetical protein
MFSSDSLTFIPQRAPLLGYPWTFIHSQHISSLQTVVNGKRHTKQVPLGHNVCVHCCLGVATHLCLGKSVLAEPHLILERRLYHLFKSIPTFFTPLTCGNDKKKWCNRLHFSWHFVLIIMIITWGSCFTDTAYPHYLFFRDAVPYRTIPPYFHPCLHVLYH